MKLGIAGAGAVAMGYAALTLTNGHSATVWSPSGFRTEALRANSPLSVTGAINGDFHPGVCTSAAELAEFDVIVLALPAYGYRHVLDSLVPHIESRHTIIISGHLSFAALYLAKALAHCGIQIPVVVWNTSVLTSKAQSPNQIRIGAIRSKVDIATVPVRLGDKALALCVELFGDRFVPKDDLLTIALSNLNPQNHMGIALCNLARIERGEAWGQNSNITPAVGRLLEALDRERVAIAAAFGKKVRTIADHYSMSFDVTGDSVAAMSEKLVERGSDPMGPRDADTRYVLEDVPFGLVPTLLLAEMVNVDAPLHQSGIALLSACYGRDFSKDNDLLPALSQPNAASLINLVVEGYSIDRAVKQGSRASKPKVIGARKDHS
tara:strand:+ start:21081 stop:22217 length:1137 start_codon:yes stop_codon:yes gene_type:complete